MHRITDVIEHFKQNSTEELSETAIAQACHEACMFWRETTLNPVMTIQIFFVQILHGNVACSDMPHLARMVFTGAGYCKARMRIGLPVFQLLSQRCVTSIGQQTLDTSRWFRHRVFKVDGSVSSRPIEPS